MQPLLIAVLVIRVVMEHPASVHLRTPTHVHALLATLDSIVHKMWMSVQQGRVCLELVWMV